MQWWICMRALTYPAEACTHQSFCSLIIHTWSKYVHWRKLPVNLPEQPELGNRMPNNMHAQKINSLKNSDFVLWTLQWSCTWVPVFEPRAPNFHIQHSDTPATHWDSENCDSKSPRWSQTDWISALFILRKQSRTANSLGTGDWLKKEDLATWILRI